MNLGQYIGELLMRLQGEEPAQWVKKEGPKPRGKRQHQVVALLSDGCTLSAADVSVALQITGSNAIVLLATMSAKGVISRHGARRHYRYTKPGVAGPVVGR